jgi:hypothetical protein
MKPAAAPPKSTDRIPPWILPAGAGLTLLAAAVVPKGASQFAVLWVGLLLGGIIAIAAGLTSKRALGKEHLAVAVAGIACTAWFGITAATATNPKIALVGAIPQHNGVALMVLTLVWLLAAMLLGSGRALRWTLLVVSAFGLLVAGIGLVQVMTGATAQLDDFANAIFENSISYGQVLAVGALCSSIWILSARQRKRLDPAWLAPVFMLAMMVLADSRTALLGVAVALAVGAYVLWTPNGRVTTPLVTASALAVVITLVAFGLMWASTGVFGDAAKSAVISVGNQRDVVWRSTAARLAESPITGRGLEQFSSVMRWSIEADASLDLATANDPHSVVVALALGGGIVGLLLGAAAFIAFQTLVLRVARAQRSPALALLAGLPVALLAMSLINWVAVAALFALVVVAGSMLGADAARVPLKGVDERPGTAVRAASILAGACALAIAAGTLGVLPVKLQDTRDMTPQQFEAAYKRWPDPFLAAAALDLSTPAMIGGDPQAIALGERLIQASSADAAERADLSVAQLTAAQALEAQDASLFPRFEAIAEAGKRADPESGFWDTMLALEAQRLGYAEKAAAYKAEALKFPLSDSTRARVERIAE